MNEKRMRRAGFLIATGAACVLFLPLRSIQWDLNGIGEAVKIEHGHERLFDEGHLLFRPLGAALFAAARSATGYPGRSAPLLQWLTATLAAAGVGAAWVWFHHLTGDIRAAGLAAAFLATSWSYWVFSTDIYYITPAAAAAAAALAFAARAGPHPLRTRLATAAWLAVAILFWQANVFLVPAVALALRHGHADRPARESWREAFRVVGISGALVLAAYLAIGAWGVGRSSPRALLRWVASLESVDSFPLWGTWSYDRIPAAMRSAVTSFVSDRALPAAAGLAQGNPRARDLPAALALVALVALATHAAVALARRGSRRIAWLAISWAAFLPFIVWWDPFEAKWFVVPNLFVAALFACAWSAPGTTSAGRLAVVAGVIAVAVANFVVTVRPRHVSANPNLELARCFARHVGPADTLVDTDWNWSGYASYFFGFTGEQVGLIGNVTEPGKNDWVLRDAGERARMRGGGVFVRDPSSYPPAEGEYFRKLTGFGESDLTRFARRRAFRCGDVGFLRLAAAETRSRR